MHFSLNEVSEETIPTLQSLTGSLQGRITYREIPVVITGNRYAEYNVCLFWLHNFPVLITLKLLL